MLDNHRRPVAWRGPRRRGVWLAAGLALLAPFPASAQPQIQVTDIGLQSRFQDTFFGHHKRGRALVAADFNLDGRVDFYAGNPGDESFVMVNMVGPGGQTVFRSVQTLLVGELAWGAAAADYDNDGDYDLFITTGGNETVGFNYLFKNQFLETGRLRFANVTGQAGVRGPIPPGGGSPIQVRNANAVWGDYDRDGDVDVFVNVNRLGSFLGEPDALRPGAGEVSNDCADPGPPPPAPRFLAGGTPADGAEPEEGRNILWRNNGDGTFTDVTDAVGLGVTFRPTRHSTFFDFDNDGDIDLYENNMDDFNVLWRNNLVEAGSAVFEDVTVAMSLPGEDLRYPYGSFASCSADFNQDGWEDLIVFKRGPTDGELYPGHALFLNQAGTGFYNAAELAALNNPYQPEQGVMGCMVGDVDADSVPDVYVGNGGPEGGQYDQLYLSDSLPGATPRFVNRTDLIDFPAPEQPGIVYPPYPYRTHGTAFVDVDGDGVLEIAVSNGGTAAGPDTVREPNRLFQLDLPGSVRYLKVRPVGDGVAVSRDAIGTRFALTVSRAGSPPWTLYRTLFGGSCFSAQNGFEVHFYLGAADTLHELLVTWPDGQRETITQGLVPDSSIVVQRGG